MSMTYDHIQIESKWRKIWLDKKIYKTPDNVTRENKMYILPQLPYPSGAGLHVGHAEGYTACDIYARYKRMKGKKVLQVIGWDAFGLPAENFAIKSNVHPRINTDNAINNFRNQIQSLGLSLDWDREVGSHNPDYYKWTQWFFLLMYERGLAYRKNQAVNWCEGCKTVLANEQVVNNKCERCGTEVVQKQMEQWFFRITDYADRLYDDLDKVDWPTETVKRQRDWIGRNNGINITYDMVGSDKTITCFTTTPVNFGATFIVLATEHPLVSEIIKPEYKEAADKYILASKEKNELERMQDKKKTGVFTGSYALNHVTGEPIPIWIADFVLSTVGTGAVQGCPGHDMRDFEFAKEFNIPIKRVVVREDGDTSPIEKPEQIIEKGTKGVMVNSDFLNGIDFEDAMQKTMDYFEEKGWGKRVVNFKLRDWSISRQRFWGAPIPMVYDPEGNIHPVDKSDLPVILPDNVDFVPTGRSPLTYSEAFQEGVEEKYGKGWHREVDTLDTFMCSSWYYFRYLDPHNDKEFASKEALNMWMPVDFHIGGPEHVTGHLLYTRFFTKVLFDAGYINFDEPFLFHRHQGMILGVDGRKMSKRWGNIINPTDIVRDYGADTARVYEMFMGPLEATKPWDTNGVVGVKRFITRIWNLYNNESKSRASESTLELRKILHKTLKKVEEDINNLKFNTAIAKMMEFVNAWEDPRFVLSLGDSEVFIKILAPFAPFISEEIYQKFIIGSSRAYGKFNTIHLQSWPGYETDLVKDDVVTVIVQVNGVLRAKFTIPTEEVGEKLSETVKKQAEALVSNYIKDKNIVNVIYVPQKLVNFVVS